MFHFFEKNKEEIINQKVNTFNQPVEDRVLSRSLNQNVQMMKSIFADVDILIVRFIQNNYDSSLKYAIAYCDGVVNSATINDSIIKPLMLSNAAKRGGRLMDSLVNHVVMINETIKTNKIKKIIESITYGDTILFADGSDEVLILNTKEIRTRAIQEPDSEKNLNGPREGFNESIIQNLSMIRRKLRTNELKMKYITLGRISQAQACICYIDKLVNKQILKEIYRRLETIDVDAVLDTNYISELIKDSPLSLFHTTGYTERPDVVVGKLLEGRIAIFLDGTPMVLTVPYLFIENFQSSEDYYMNFYYTSFSRFLRILGFIMTISIPGFYIAVVAYQLEMLPTSLLINIASDRKSVPLPAALEAFIMLIIFDILRETGIRMPSNVGQALSIVGALVIGQAAVDAKLVASPMIIVVATTGITSLLVPKMNAPVIYIRMFLLLCSSWFGMFGLVAGLSCVFINMLNLHSFGVPQLLFSGSLQYQEVKDTFIRAPWWQMITRGKKIAQDKVRMKLGNGGSHG